MIWLYRLLIVLVSSTVFNVWLLRLGNATPYRGGAATNLQEEFLAYGLNETVFYLIGGVKLLAALGLLIGLKVPQTVKPSAQIIAVLMLGAIGMHFKIADPIVRSLPALAMLGMCLGILRLNKKAQGV